jgi:hypothetical protein
VKTEILGEKPAPSAPLPTTNLKKSGLGLKSGRNEETPVTNRLSRGMKDES